MAYTRVNDFKPRRDSLLRGATYTRVYTVRTKILTTQTVSNRDSYQRDDSPSTFEKFPNIFLML